MNYLIIYFEAILSARSTLYIDIPEGIDPGSTMLHSHTQINTILTYLSIEKNTARPEELSYQYKNKLIVAIPERT